MRGVKQCYEGAEIKKNGLNGCNSVGLRGVGNGAGQHWVDWFKGSWAGHWVYETKGLATGRLIDQTA